jgi:hypothetical protein
LLSAAASKQHSHHTAQHKYFFHTDNFLPFNLYIIV